MKESVAEKEKINWQTVTEHLESSAPWFLNNCKVFGLDSQQVKHCFPLKETKRFGK